MSDFFQIKIVGVSAERLPGQACCAAEQMGLSADYWVVRNAMWCEDYLDRDREDIENHVTVNEAYGRQATLYLDLGWSRGSALVVAIRNVPALVRQGNSDRGFIVSDDIANQMASEIKVMVEGELASGPASEWFANAVRQFNAFKKEDNALKTFSVRSALGKRDWRAEDAEHAAEQHYDAFPDERITEIKEV
jgi:hypothetical protein